MSNSIFLVKPKNNDFFKLIEYLKTLKSSFLIPKAKLAFTKLRKTFDEASIFYYRDSECYI